MSSDFPDRVVIALASIGSGAAGGAGVMTAGLVLLRTGQAGSATAPIDDHGLLLVVAVFLAVVAAAATAWGLGRRIDDTWRRGVTAALATFGACMLAGLAVPVDLIGGRPGLLAYLLVLVGAAVLGGRRARRAEAEPANRGRAAEDRREASGRS